MDFEVRTRYTLDEQKQFHRALLFRRKHTLIAAIGILVLTGLDLYFGMLYGMDVFLKLLPYTVAYVVFMAIFFWLLERDSVKMWKSKKLTQDAVISFHFTPDYVEVTGVGSDGIYTYDKFLKLIETKTHFYPMFTSGMGVVICKDACTTEQQDYIREKCIGRMQLKKMGMLDAAKNGMPEIEPGEEDQDTGAEAPMYTAKVKYTLKEYLKYNAAMVARNVRMYVILGILLIWLMIHYYRYDGIYGLRQGIIMFVVAICSAFLLIFFLVFLSWKKNPLMKNSEEYYIFFDDRIEISHSAGKTVLPFDKLYKIIETGSSFYIMAGRGQGLILSKSECSDELIRFMEEKKLIVEGK